MTEKNEETLHSVCVSAILIANPAKRFCRIQEVIMSDFENLNGNEQDLDGADMEEVLGSVTLTLEDDSEVECLILAIYQAGGKDYIALLPVGEDGEPDDNSDVLIYRYIDNGEEEPEIENIEDDEEYEAAADAFDELLDEQDFEDEEE